MSMIVVPEALLYDAKTKTASATSNDTTGKSSLPAAPFFVADAFGGADVA